MIKPELKFFATLTVELGPIRELGEGLAGRRRIIPIVGGTVAGPDISGKILNIGADWQTVFDSETAELDTRYALETHDGAVIEVINFGYRHGPPDVLADIAEGKDVDPSLYYMRTHARLETGDPRYGWVNAILFIGTGRRNTSSVEISLFAVQ